MPQLIFVIVIALLGIYIFFQPFVDKGIKKVKTKQGSTEYADLAEDYEQEMNNDDEDNKYLDLLRAIESYNEEISQGEFEFKEFPKNINCFDTTEFGIDVDTFGYVEVEYKGGIKGNKTYYETFPLFFKATSANKKAGVIPLPTAGLPIGTYGTSILFGYPKKSLRAEGNKVLEGSTIAITTIYGTTNYRVMKICAFSKQALQAFEFQMDTKNVILIIGTEDKYYKNVFFCSPVGEKDS